MKINSNYLVKLFSALHKLKKLKINKIFIKTAQKAKLLNRIRTKINNTNNPKFNIMIKKDLLNL